MRSPRCTTDMPDPRTHSSVAQRLDIEVERYPNALHRRRRWLTLAAGIVPLLWLGFATWRGDSSIYLSRPIATSHQHVSHDCAMCHQTPWQPLVRLARLDNTHRSVRDEDCQRCHRQSKQDHHHRALTLGVPDCAHCHQEHRGALRLTEQADSFCVKCHAPFEQHPQISLHRTWAAEKSAADFWTEETAAALQQVARLRPRENADAARENGWEDKSSLHFSHHQHLQPLATPWDSRRDPDSSPKQVQLDCGDCHQPDATGHHMRPIVYEQHCGACHPLRFSGKLTDEPLPHVRPDILRGVLRDRLLTYARQHPEELQASQRNEPSRLPNKPPARPTTSRDQWEWVELELRLVENAIFQTPQFSGQQPRSNACQKCHLTKAPSPDEAIGSRLGFEIIPPQIPERWLARSHFRHDRHRDMACRDCHHTSSAEPSGEPASDLAYRLDSHGVQDILLPKIEICQQCHGAPSGSPIKRHARGNCVECHRYHHVPERRELDESTLGYVRLSSLTQSHVPERREVDESTQP